LSKMHGERRGFRGKEVQARNELREIGVRTIARRKKYLCSACKNGASSLGIVSKNGEFSKAPFFPSTHTFWEDKVRGRLGSESKHLNQCQYNQGKSTQTCFCVSIKPSFDEENLPIRPSTATRKKQSAPRLSL